MYKKIVLLVVLCFLFTISCSSPSNPDNGNQGNNGGSTPLPPTGPTEEELIAKYGIDIGLDNATIIQQIKEKLQLYFDEYKDYRIVFIGNPRSYDESLSSLIVQAVSSLQSITEIDVDIRFINFKDNTISGGMFSGQTYNENIFFNFIFPENKIKTIEMMAFANLENIKHITIPNSVTMVEKYGFGYCFQLEKLVFEEGITTIWAGSFPIAEKLKELIIPSTVISIEDEALMNHGLTELTIPNSVKSIGNKAFSTSITLTKLTLPASLTSIGSKAFSACGKLTTVIYYGTSPDTIKNNDALLECNNLTTLIVPNALDEKDPKWNTFLGGSFTTVTK